MPFNASQLYSRNVYALISPFIKDGTLALDPEDEVIKGACIVRGGTSLLGGTGS
jgi:NAD(P) transhydrogenase subunit alpha